MGGGQRAAGEVPCTGTLALGADSAMLWNPDLGAESAVRRGRVRGWRLARLGSPNAIASHRPAEDVLGQRVSLALEKARILEQAGPRASAARACRDRVFASGLEGP